ncbi:non-hydrolyzing UDP-N-acetylglucosamine 2-epimerase [Marinibactrum halimedae]|uniref:UDP-N-acetyl glucosamine 2-epimerase n=1 Tax=Marinibactrum halimedae TaxID=1444977 RepID=A0AA37T6D8_9GAMM|nr:UDP-N-acetylglucosamine 2-epimerase (non-hydrolyzing) [Marinibactrum halimedae]MCD9458032.1 UDP-N-acetylglucosamine 2-epimerase (non-hydrolyzing) [Marinibactrum halimedae]GLS27659.1 UDP-N-acetyl glucosamine 2-epimerase [Marinibactrum halimedae]
MKIVTIVGARPQFIKAAALSREIALHDGIDEVIIHTGQHFDDNMSHVFFKELHIPPPTHTLKKMGDSHGEMTGNMLIEIENLLKQDTPDVVLVYGDTNSTLAGALAASKLHIPIAHVEAGLRSYNKKMPEEQNRILTDHLSTWLFAPTEQAVKNATKENIAPHSIHNVGDIMQDVAHFYGNREKITNNPLLKKIELKNRDYILATFHRAENTDSPTRMTTIVNALCELGKAFSIILPLHPRTKKVLNHLNLLKELEKHTTVINPVGYLDMVTLEKKASVIVTDSGGIQKESYFYHTPCVTLRDETEWVELLAEGHNLLCPPLSESNIIDAVHQQWHRTLDYDKNPLYGTGNTAQNIINILKNTQIKA